MENKEQQILSEIKSMMGAIRSQLELLDAKMAELQQCVDPEEFDSNPIELDIEEGVAVDDDLPFDEPAEVETVQDVETVDEADETVEADVNDDDDDDLPGVFDQPVPVYQAAQSSPKVKPSVADAMTEKQAWRTDMPGSPVKDVRSAISLNDRIIFINYLFDEDPLAFQEAITQINAMQTLDQVVEYVMSGHPSWDMGSELVYRFMMAVRRRVK